MLFGALTVYFSWAAMRALVPKHPVLAIGVAATIALLPQFSFNMASVSNDSAVNCMGAASIYSWIVACATRPTTSGWCAAEW